MFNPATFLRRGLPTARSTTSTPLTFIRHESNTRRHTKRLRMPPHPDFKPYHLTTDSPSLTHILHNPPAAASNVFITPKLFLPKDDPRHAIYATTPKGDTPKKPKLPPPVTEIKEKKYHLTPTDFSRMRSLRKSNPNVWTRAKLAEEFSTSKFFAGMVAQADDKRKEKMWAKMEKVKERWGPKRRNARIDRAKRREGWGGADGY